MKRKDLQIITILAVTAATIWGFHHWYTTRADFKKEELARRAEGVADLEQKVLGFSLDGKSAKGGKQWHLEGRSAEIRGDEIYLNDLSAVVYGDEVTANLTSDKGIYYRDRKEVDLYGNVEVISDDGTILTTDRATWSQVTRNISTDAVVYIVQEEMTAMGIGGRANSDKKTATLEKDVKVTMEPDTKIDCDGPLEISYNDNIAIFYGNVMVEDKDGRLFSDKLTVEFDPETKKMALVTAEGNVKIKRGKSYTISEKAVYTDSTKHAKLFGRPRVIIDPEQLAELENRDKDTGFPDAVL